MDKLFNIGDPVRLKGGGCRMTIITDKLGIDLSEGYYFDGSYECSWLEGKKTKYDVFSQDALEKVYL